MVEDPSSQGRIIQFCTTLGRACGVADYTRMLATAKGHTCVSGLDQLRSYRPVVVHLQHEFSIVPYDVLRDLAQYCLEQEVPLYVTMHTVPPPIPRLTRAFHMARFAAEKAVPLLRRLPPLPAGGDEAWWLEDEKPGAGARPSPLLPWRVASEHAVFVMRSLRLISLHARTVFAHSKEAVHFLRRHGMPRVAVTTMGIERHPLAPSRLSQTVGGLHVGCFGFLNRTRCVLELIEGCRIGNATLHLFMSTAGLVADADYTRRVAATVAASTHVEWVDEHRPAAEIVERLASCDVNAYLSAPLDHLSSSGALRQYLAACRPVIATDSPRTADVRHLLHLLPDNRPERLALALTEAPRDASAVVAWVERNTWDRIVVDYA